MIKKMSISVMIMSCLSGLQAMGPYVSKVKNSLVQNKSLINRWPAHDVALENKKLQWKLVALQQELQKKLNTVAVSHEKPITSSLGVIDIHAKHELCVQADPILSAHYNHEGTQIVTASKNSVCVWDANSGKRLKLFQTPKLNEDYGVDAKFNHDSSSIIVRSKRADLYGKMCILDAQTGEPVRQVQEYLAVDDNGKFIVAQGVFSEDMALSIDEVYSNQRKAWPIDRVSCATISNDGAIVVTQSYEQKDTWLSSGGSVSNPFIYVKVQVWDAVNLRALCDIRRGEFGEIVLNRDTMRMAFVTRNFIEIMDMKTGRIIAALTRFNTELGCPFEVNSVQFNSTGSHVLTCTGYESAHVWDALTGKCLYTLTTSSGVLSAKFNSDDALIITAGVDGQAQIWDAVTGQQLANLQPPNCEKRGWLDVQLVSYAEFNNDSSQVLVVVDEKSYIFDIGFLKNQRTLSLQAKLVLSLLENHSAEIKEIPNTVLNNVLETLHPVIKETIIKKYPIVAEKLKDTFRMQTEVREQQKSEPEAEVKRLNENEIVLPDGQRVYQPKKITLQKAGGLSKCNERWKDAMLCSSRESYKPIQQASFTFRSFRPFVSPLTQCAIIKQASQETREIQNRNP